MTRARAASLLVSSARMRACCGAALRRASETCHMAALEFVRIMGRINAQPSRHVFAAACLVSEHAAAKTHGQVR